MLESSGNGGVSRASPRLDAIPTYMPTSLTSSRMTTESEIWRVQLPTGELRAFSLDALDQAFDAGLIHGGTMVLAPGATEWAPLGLVAGLDSPDPEPVQTPSLSPMAIANDGQYHASYPPPAPLPFADVADLSDDALKPKRGRMAFVAAIGVAAIAACGVLAAPKVGKILANVHPDKASVNAMQAPPPAVDVTGDGFKPNTTLTPEQKRLLLEADKKKEEDRKKREEEARAKAAKRPARGKGKSSQPFVNGGDKYDPLNGSL